MPIDTFQDAVFLSIHDSLVRLGFLTCGGSLKHPGFLDVPDLKILNAAAAPLRDAATADDYADPIVNWRCYAAPCVCPSFASW